ncbi:MAG TPA: Yip1 family protein [Candidatus Binatia bacterium]|nr:Yip1 family protein [Candidatus Binatia bacterium]
MSAEHEKESRSAPRRFSLDDARERAQQAIRKSEFILSRAYGLLREPRKEWDQIKAEETTIPNILIGYTAPLAAIPPLCDLIGQSLFNYALQVDFGQAVIRAVVTWLVSIALVFFLGVLVNVLAETFEADKDELGAQKIAAYSLTPAFLSGFFSLWPPLWWLSLIALAAMVYLMYRGLPILMRAPKETATGYTAAVTIGGLVALIVLFALAGCVS